MLEVSSDLNGASVKCQAKKFDRVDNRRYENTTEIRASYNPEPNKSDGTGRKESDPEVPSRRQPQPCLLLDKRNISPGWWQHSHLSCLTPVIWPVLLPRYN